MATIITEIDVAEGNLRGSDRQWVYNGLDCCVTEEVRAVLAPRVARDPAVNRTYKFELSCQAPAMAMMLRGAAFDEAACTRAIRDWEIEEKKNVEHARSEIGALWPEGTQRKGRCADAKPHRWNNAKNVKAEVRVACDDTDAVCLKCGCARLVAAQFNPLSSPQVIKLLYTVLKLPIQHSRKGARGVTADDEALEKLKKRERTSERDVGIIRNILDCRKAHKQIGFLKSKRSADGRLRQSVNVGATETGRWSASKDPFREGTNFQNIADRSRNVIVADPGLWLFYADLEQAESKIVAYDAEDDDYINAHNAGDVHTVVARMVWPELPWTGDARLDREVADRKTPWDAEHSYRDYAKHVQHGGNIGQTPHGMARDAHIPLAQAKDVYERMYGVAFPGVRRRQREIMAQVGSTGILVTPLERKRQFFGRLWEPSTQREGMAQTQQSSIADLLNLALRRVWEELDTRPNLFNAPKLSDPNKVWLLAQVHDAILGLVRPHDIKTVERIRELMTIPVPIRGRVCTIATDIALGTNFRHFNPKKADTIGGIAGWHVDGERIVIHNTRDYLKKD